MNQMHFMSHACARLDCLLIILFLSSFLYLFPFVSSIHLRNNNYDKGLLQY